MNATTNTEIQTPSTFGAPFEDGFYGGKIRVGIAIFAIVWAPKAEGEIMGKWMDACTDVQGATSYFDSMANTRAMAESGSEIAKQALAVSIGGHTDWCIPARDVLEMGYRYLKPSTKKNYCTFRDGDNPSSIPAGYPYTENNPLQTTEDLFQKGNAEAFDEAIYFSSTQDSEGRAWVQFFDDGDQDYLIKAYERRCRFVRLIQLNT